MEEHFVIERFVDPSAHHVLETGKIQDHPKAIELGSRERDHRPTVVAVQVPTFAFVFQQTMPITELDFARYAVHGTSVSYSVSSTMPAAAKAWRRSAHLLQ